MATIPTPAATQADFQRLRPRTVLTHNIYEILTEKVVDSTQPGGYLEVSRFGRLLSSEEIYDAIDWEVSNTLGLAADTYRVNLPNFDGKYTSVFEPGEEIAVSVGYPTDPDNYTAADLIQVIIGRIDDVDFDMDKNSGELIIIEGRNYAAPFLDNRVSKKFENKTATQIVTSLVNLYGFGVTADITIPNDKKFNKTVITRSGTSNAVLSKFNANSLTNIPPSVLNPAKATGAVRTGQIIDNVIGKNDTAWKVLQDLALALADPKTGLEYKVYVEGKKLYFGPRQDNLQPSETLSYGVTALSMKFRKTTQFLKTRIIMRQYVQAKKKTYDIIVPDDLGPDMITPAEKQKYLDLRKRYGVRDLLVKDLRKFIRGNTNLAKLTGLARLRESARLLYTGTIEAPGNPLITKEGTVKVTGIPDSQGAVTTEYPYKVSTVLNATYYIEGTKHHYSKETGYTNEISVSTRRPDQVRKLQASTSAAAALPSNEEPDEASN